MKLPENSIDSFYSGERDVAVIGMACRFPGASDYAEFWRNLLQGVNSVKEIPRSRWDHAKYYSADGAEARSHSKWCGLLDDIDLFDAPFFNISPREASDMDPQQRLLLEETLHCIEDAGIALQELQTRRTGVFVGCATADYLQISSSEDTKKDTYAVLGNYRAVQSNRISYYFNFTGPSLSIDTACASALFALHEAIKSLHAGECDYAIVGAVNVNIHPWKYVVISQANMLSRDGQCRTFDIDANGYVPGDGVGVVLLQRRSVATAANNRINGIIKASAVNHNGRSLSISAPSVDAQRELIRSVYLNAGISPRTVTYVEAHGTGTSLGDPIEVEALHQAFAAYTPDNAFCHIGSVKSNIGHLEGAAGMAGLLKVLLMMRHRWIPRTLHIETVNPIIDFEKTPFIPARNPCEWQRVRPDIPLRASVSAFGFSGSNAHILIEEPTPGNAENAQCDDHNTDSVPRLLTLSARSAKSLKRLIDRWKGFVESAEFRAKPLQDLCATSLNSRSHLEYRFGFAIQDKTDIQRRLNEYEVALDPKKIPWCLRIAEYTITGYAEIAPILKEFTFVAAELDVLLDQLDSQVQCESGSVRDHFYRERWDDDWQIANEILFGYAYLSALMKLGFEPAMVSSSGRGIYLACVASRMTTAAEMVQAILSRRLDRLSLGWPEIPVYDAVHQKEIHRSGLTQQYLRSLFDAAEIGSVEIDQAIERTRLLLGRQFTFSKYFEEWISAADRVGIDIRKFLDDSPLSTRPQISHAERICFAVAAANAIHRVKDKWQLTDSLDIANVSLHELMTLLNDGILTAEQFVQLLADPAALCDPVIQAMQKALDRTPQRNKYRILAEINRNNGPIDEPAVWIDRSTQIKQTNPVSGGMRLLDIGHVDDSATVEVRIPAPTEHLRDEVLLKLWLAGASVQWSALIRELTFSKTALPLYPFDGQRYWIETNPNCIAPVVNTAVAVLHPLVHRNTSNSSQQCFTSTFDGHEFFLRDHQVEGRAVLPGVAYLEMARKSFEVVTGADILSTSSIHFKSVIWAQPIHLGSQSTTVHIRLKANGDGTVGYEIDSESEGSDRPVLHGQGVISARRRNTSPVLDLTSLQRETSIGRLDSKEFYKRYRSAGIDYGPAFQGVCEMFVGHDQGLARILLPPSVADTAADYILHPSILDSALQAAVALQMTSASSMTLMPFSVESIDVFAATQNVMWSWVRVVDGDNAESPRRLDIDLCDESGRVCVRLKGFSVRRSGGKQTVRQQTRNIVSTPDSSLLPIMAKPVWTAWETCQTVRPQVDPSSRILIFGANPQIRPALSTTFPHGRFVEPFSDWTEPAVIALLGDYGPVDHIVWLCDEHPVGSVLDEALIEAQDSGVLRLFALIKAVLHHGSATREMEWTIFTTSTQFVQTGDRVDPTNASIIGLVGSMAKEFPHWRVRLFDVDELASSALSHLPDDTSGRPVAYRRGQWFRREFIPVRALSANDGLFRRNGIYVVIGGAGGISREWSRWLIERYQAQLIWIGRREKNSSIQSQIDQLGAIGPAPYYISADAADQHSLQTAYDEIKKYFPVIHGLVHSAIVLQDSGLARMTREQFTASLAVNVDVCVRMAEVFQKEPLDFVLFHSSIQSFCTFAGQSNYAAGCTFKDAFADRLRQEWRCAVKVVNWGYWGSVGVVANEYYRESMAQRGLHSIEPEEGFDLLQRLMDGPIDQLAILKTSNGGILDGFREDEWIETASAPDALPNLSAEAASQWLPRVPQLDVAIDDGGLCLPGLAPILGKFLWATVQSVGFSGRNQAPLTAIREAVDGSGRYQRWVDETLAILERHNYLHFDGDFCLATDPTLIPIDEVWKEWSVRKERYLSNAQTRPQVVLLDACLQHLQDILTGRALATDVIFPDSSTELAAGVYKNHRVADYCNQSVAGIVKAYIDEHLKKNRFFEARILEIGAGTGGTSQAILSMLGPIRDRIAEYCYTDISTAFFHKAREQFARDWPKLVTRQFDVEKPLAEQSVALGGYDVVVAANVLHATRDIRNTIRNAKAALRRGGLLVLIELSANSPLLHLTFGLLNGWWLYEDPEVRIPGSPGLYPDTWRTVLAQEGFQGLTFPAAEAHQLGQQIIVAHSDGIVRQRQHKVSTASPAVSKAISVAKVQYIEPPEQMSEDRVKTIIRESVAASLRINESEIQDGRIFSDYGVDSIIGVQLVNQINKGCNVSIPVTALFDYNNINELAAFVSRQFKPRATAARATAATSLATNTPSHIDEVGKGALSDGASIWGRAQGSRRIVIERPGQVADIVFTQVPHPVLGPRDICIAVRACSLNFADLLCVKGLYPNMPDYPFTPGVEASGVVAATGDSVTRVRIGDPVIAFMGKTMGAHAAVIKCSEDDVFKKPETLSFEEACALPAVGITMVYAFRKAQLRRGERILIQTAAGGTGLMAVQLAQYYGAEIFATAGSDEKLEYLRNLGVAHTINYRETDFAAEIRRLTRCKGVDVVINTLSGDAIQKGMNCLSAGGRYIELAMTALRSAKGIDLSVLQNNQAFYSIDLIRLASEDRVTFSSCYEEMIGLATRGILRPTISHILPFDRIPDAYRYLEDRRNIGKIVVSVSDGIAPNLEPSVGSKEGIAIVGMSGRFAKSPSLADLWQHLANGDDLVENAARWDLRHAYSEDLQDSQKACYSGSFLENIDEFDAGFFDISAVEAAHMDPQQRLFLEEAWKALEDAGYAGSTIEGRTCGVYVGCAAGDYARLLPKRPPAHSFWGNAGSVIPARISYYLNLRGPAIAIDTACSSSLVAIHMACDSLRNHETELALAGGVFIQSTADFYVASNRAGMLSQRGHCHTFDGRADGFVPGEGVGVLVLKRLNDAIKDGDHVYGVIRGSGLNQDGRTNGLTAPSANSQERLERQVYEKFSIHPDHIQMVEAHGTGTKLGDPIEFQALTKAFRKDTQRRGFCAIGSIKSNLGHTATAAGVAGILKILLALKHRQIPPTLHFESGNPAIEFNDSPFYVNTHLRQWDEPEGGVRTAVVSSFGFSGTNAHMVIEQAPETDRKDRERPAYLIVLSAISSEQLRRQAVQLVNFCEQHPGTNIGSISCTLLMGRKHSIHRLATIVQDVEELTGYLRKWLATQRVPQVRISEIIDDQRSEDKSLTEFGNECIQACSRTGDTDVYLNKLGAVAALFSQGYRLKFEALFAEGGYSKISLPTYPFSRDSYWVQTAAEDRNNNGSRTSSESTGRLHPLVQQNHSTLEAQLYRSEFTGEEFFLADHRFNEMRVMPAVAYLEMAISAASHAVSNGSSRAGIQLRNVVWPTSFAVNGASQSILIRVAPGRTATIDFEIVDGAVQSGRDVVFCQGALDVRSSEPPPAIDVASLRRNATKVIDASECYTAFEALGFRYGPAHRGLESLAISDDYTIAKLSLPPIPALTGNDYVLHPSIMDAALQATIALLTPSATARLPYTIKEVNVYQPTEAHMWAIVRSTNSAANSMPTAVDIDICNENGVVCVGLKELTLREIDRGATSIVSHPLFFEPRLELKPITPGAAASDFVQHWVVLCGLGAFAEHSGHLGGIQSRVVPMVDRIEEYFETCVAEVVDVVHNIVRTRTAGPKLLQVLIGRSDDAGILQPLSGLAGIVRTISQEDPSIVAQLIEIELSDSKTSILEKIHDNRKCFQDQIISYRNRQRHVRSWQELPCIPADPPLPWKKNGIYLITGGAGGLGRIFAREICEHAAGATVILTGRSALDTGRLAEIESLGSTGATVRYRQSDICQKTSVEALIQWIREEIGDIDGVIHCAGTLHDSLCVNKTRHELNEVLAPKVYGLVHLDLATADMPLDFLACFSSVAAGLGNVGQADYAAANGFMDAFAHHRTALAAAGKRSGLTLSINWPLWQASGFHVSQGAAAQMLRTFGMTPMPSAAGIRAFYQCFAAGLPQVMVLNGNEERIRKVIHGSLENVYAPPSPKQASGGIGEDVQGLREKTADFLRRTLASVLGFPLERVKDSESFERYGIDSILAVELTNELEKTFGSLSKILFFEHHNIPSLADYLIQNHKASLIQAVGGKETAGTRREAPATVLPTKAAVPSLSRSADSLATAPLEIAVVGLAGRYPGARTTDEFWENLRIGKDCISEIPDDRWDYRRRFTTDKNKLGGIYSKWGGFIDGVDEFDPLFFNISPRDAELIDPQERLFLQCIYETIEDAGYVPSGIGPNVGVFVGVMYEEYQFLGVEETIHGRPLALPGNPSSIANRVSYFCNFNGPCMVVDTMCSSSLTAIHLACQSLRLGECETAIAGGVNISIHPNKYLLLSQGRFVSSAGRCESFGTGGDGYVPGEGVGSVLLKPLSCALRDGDHIYGVIQGTAVNHGGKTNGFTVPNPNAQGALIARAIKQAGIRSRSIGYVEAHGTGTSLGDPIEIAGLKQAFQMDSADRQYCAIGSVKSNIGHCESAAGIAGITKVLMQLKHKQLVPSLHSRTLNPIIDFSETPFHVQQELSEWDSPMPRIAGVSSFGAGGSNAHVIIQEAPDQSRPAQRLPSTTGDDVIIVLSARTDDRLTAVVSRLHDYLQRRTDANRVSLTDLAYTLQVGRVAMESRLAFIVRSYRELTDTLQNILTESSKCTNVFRGNLNRRGDSLAEIWVNGADVDWTVLYRAAKPQPQRVSLPSYPFARERYWAIDRKKTPATIAPEEFRRLILTKEWKAAPLPERELTGAGVVIILGTQKTAGLASYLFKNLPSIRVLNVLQEEPGDSSAILTDFYSAPAGELLYRRLETLTVNDELLGIIDCTALDATYGRPSIESGKIRLLQLLIQRETGRHLKLLQVVSRLYPFRSETTTLHGARLAGLYRMISAEYRRVKSWMIDVDLALSASLQLASLVQREFLTDQEDSATEICYRQRLRYQPYLAENDSEYLSADGGPLSGITPDDVFMVTGGTRGIGAAVTERLISRGARRLVVLGREDLPAQSQWKSIVKNGATPELRSKLEFLLSIVNRGVQVRYFNTTLTDSGALQAMLRRVHDELGPVCGVFHCAGLSGQNPAYIRKPVAEIQAVCEPKIQGLVELDRALAAEPLRFFVLFSSVASTIPFLSAGQSDYAMANAFMDFYALNQASHGRKIFKSIQWPAWSETGMAAGKTDNPSYVRSGLLRLSTADGMSFLEALMNSDLTVSLPAVVNPAEFDLSNLLNTHLSESRSRPDGDAKPVAVNATSSNTSSEAKRREIQTWLREIFMSELKLSADQLQETRQFDEYGVESVMIAQLVQIMQKRITAKLSPSLLLEHASIAALTEYFATAHAADFGAGEPLEVPTVDNSSRKISSDPTRTDSSLDIAIVGISCSFPDATSKAEYWNQLANGHCAVKRTEHPRWKSADDRLLIGGWLDDIDAFDATYFHLNGQDAAIMDPQARLLLEQALFALLDAGYDSTQVAGEKVGVYIGGRSSMPKDVDALLSSPNPVIANQNYLATNISRFFNFAGPSVVVDTACSSALTAMLFASDALKAGRIKMAMVGGVNLLLTSDAHRLFAERQILSDSGEFRIFDRRATGEVLGEGVGVLILRRLEDAVADGNQIYGVIKAIASNNDGRTLGPGSPNIKAQKHVMLEALEAAAIRPEDVGYIEVNGGGSPVVDAVEIKAVSEVYRLEDRHLAPCFVGSVKPNVGHLLLASGLAGFIRCVLSVHHKQVPPFLSALEPFDYYDFSQSRICFNRGPVNWEVAPGKKRIAAQSSFPDGGTNVHVLIEEFVPDGSYQQRLYSKPNPALRRTCFSASSAPIQRPSVGYVTRMAKEEVLSSGMMTFLDSFADTRVDDDLMVSSGESPHQKRSVKTAWGEYDEESI